MNVKPDRHRPIGYLAVCHHVCQPDVVASALDLHSVGVVPIHLDVLNLDIARAIQIDQRLPAQNDRTDRSETADRISG